MTISSKYPSIKPSLLLDFANTKSIDPRIIFSRASTATYFDNTGLMKTAAANVGRINHDPVTGACKGFLIEEQRTNLLTYSEQFDNVAWARTGGENVFANTALAPDGTITFDKLTVGTSTFTQVTQSATATVPAVHSGSVYIKAGEIGFAQVRIRNPAAQSNYIRTVIDLATGVLSSTANFGNASGATASAVNIGGAWRVTLSGVVDTAGTQLQLLVIAMKDAATVASASNSAAMDGIYIWGAQLEAGAFPTSYIPTTSAQVTRATDSASMTGANFTSWYNPSEGTLFSEADLAVVAGKISYIASLNSETSNNFMSFAQISGTSGVGRITASGVTQSDCYLGEFASGIPRKTASAYKENSFAASANGGTAVTDSSGTIPTVSTLTIGGLSNDPTLRMNGHIKRLAYYPKRLSDIELQAITS